MSDEKPKPFARVERRREQNHDRVALYVAERFIASEPTSPSETLPQIAGEVNAAVEQREAKLRGALSALLHEHARWLLASDRDAELRVAIADAYAALAGTGPEYVAGDVACGCAMDLGIALGTVEDLALVAEAFHGTAAEYARDFLRAKGLAEKQNKTPLLIPQNWHLTRAQHKKLSKLVERPVLAVPIDRERLMNMGSSEDEATVLAAVQQVAHERFQADPATPAWDRRVFATEETEVVDIDISNGTARMLPGAVGVATEALAEGQEVEIDFMAGTVRPVAALHIANGDLTACGRLPVGVTVLWPHVEQQPRRDLCSECLRHYDDVEASVRASSAAARR